MKSVLVLAAVGEAATGVALLMVPSLVGRLLFGEELAGVAIPVARVTGIALIALRNRLLAGAAAGRQVDQRGVVTLYFAHLGLWAVRPAYSCGRRSFCTRSCMIISGLDINKRQGHISDPNWRLNWNSARRGCGLQLASSGSLLVLLLSAILSPTAQAQQSSTPTESPTVILSNQDLAQSAHNPFANFVNLHSVD